MQYIDTPAVVIDLKKVEANLVKFQKYATENNIILRPHIKTHKIPRLARMQEQFGAKGICCATLGEAELMAANGITDIFIAYTIVGKEKIERFLALGRQIRVICGIDSLVGAQEISDMAIAHKQKAEVRIEIDSGFQRAGVQSENVVEFARKVVAMPGLNLTGIFTFKSSTLQGKQVLDFKACAKEEGKILKGISNSLVANGIAITEVSGGSTPTGKYVAQCEGITELRAGTYIFNDRPKLIQGIATVDECAARVKVTVVSTPTPNRAIIDGGSKIFSGDGKIDSPPLHMHGYGHIVGHENLVFDHMNEEHGIIVSKEGPTNLKVYDTLYIIPNHICTTMNLCNFVYIQEKDGTFTKTKVEGRGLVN